MEKTKNIPKIRFKGYKDEWEKKELGTLIKLNGRIGFRGYTRKDIISKEDGGVLAFSPTNIIGNKLTIKCNNTYITRYKYNESPEIKVYNNDILFVKTGSTLGKSALVNNLNEDATINPQIVVIRAKKCDERFLSASLTTKDVLEQVNAVKIGGAIPTLNEEKIKEIKVMLPKNKEEQKQIGSLFKNLDEKLKIEREKHEKLMNFKKAMLENVFPKEGEKRPKIRFGGYNDDWEDYSIERLPGFKSFDKGNGLTKDDLLMNDKYNKAILYGHIFTEYGNYLSEVKFSTKKFSDKYTFSEIGDLIIPASSTTSDNSIARGLAVNIPNVIYGGDINVIRFNNDITNVFLAYYMDNNFLKNKIFEVVQGTTIHHLYLNNIKDISVSIPSIEEQKLIGSFFKNLDEKIQVSEEKIIKIENFKKAMMEAMFV